MARSAGIEKRLFEAVVLVLASSGCYTTPPPRPPDPQPTPPREVGNAPDPWAQPPTDNPDAGQGSAQAPVTSPAANVHQLCASRKRTPLGAKKPAPPTSSPTATRSAIAESSVWDSAHNAARCTIVRDQQPTNVSVTYTPRCCPMPGQVQRTCPGPQTTSVPTALVLVERADVAPDGTVLSSNLNWVTIEPNRQPEPYCGRLPEGACALGDREPCDRAVSDHLAAMAELEAASIYAFERLARELAAHGAPASLVSRAHTAKRDEIRHARTMRTLAVRHGASPRPIAVTDLPCRSLLEIAIENVVEGCVREAYGALVATYQAERAPAQLRAVFRAVARDERRHASLAEDVHAWIIERLDDAARAHVLAERARAELELRAMLPAMPRCEELGMPTAPHAVALFDAYFAS